MTITKKAAFQERGVWITGREEFDEDRDLTFQAKVYEPTWGPDGSEFGIESGKIVKLEIRLGDEVIARFDRGFWDIEVPEEAMPLYAAICAEFN